LQEIAGEGVFSGSLSTTCRDSGFWAGFVISVGDTLIPSIEVEIENLEYSLR